MPHSKVKDRLGKILAAFAIAGALIAAPAVAANATTHNLRVDNEHYNVKQTYNTARYHGVGPASFVLLSHSNVCGSAFQISLMHTSGDSTKKLEWFARGEGVQSFRWHTGSLTLPSGSYRVTAQNNCAGMPDITYDWTGRLEL